MRRTVRCSTQLFSSTLFHGGYGKGRAVVSRNGEESAARWLEHFPASRKCSLLFRGVVGWRDGGEFSIEFSARGRRVLCGSVSVSVRARQEVKKKRKKRYDEVLYTYRLVSVRWYRLAVSRRTRRAVKRRIKGALAQSGGSTGIPLQKMTQRRARPEEPSHQESKYFSLCYLYTHIFDMIWYFYWYQQGTHKIYINSNIQ